ncbi:MAG: succinylglutamate desuccinylase/aspartoacylase family protein [Desulfarculaceae bacterium]|jgi:predicted deacylase
MEKLYGNKITASVLLGLTALIGVWVSLSFISMWHDDVLYPQAGFQKKMLSEYFAGIANTPADTPVYIQTGPEKGGTVLLLGGTHGNEPAARITAVVLLENAKVKKGRLIIIPTANPMNLTHNAAQDAHPQRLNLSLPSGKVRSFRMGSRVSNPIYEWPNPDTYIHPASGQQLAGSEKSNLNRAYPGLADGAPTERLAYAIVQLIKKEKVDLAIDLHEASPEYPVVNAMVAHERAMDLAAMVAMEMESMGIPIRLEPSPKNLRGLSHREWGNATRAMAVLLETANPSHGRFRGKTDQRLAITGQDKAYTKAATLGRLYIDYKGDQTLEYRVGRHLAALGLLFTYLGEVSPEKAVEINGIPAFAQIMKNGVGAYLADKTKGR